MAMLLVLVSLLAVVGVPAAQAWTVDTLRTEFLRDPLGVDKPNPRFSWTVQGHARGGQQEAWQVVVNETFPGAPGRNVWTSSKVASSQNYLVEYKGLPLRSDAAYAWTVQVWDGQGSVHSSVATFATGLLNASDWTAQWIVPSAGNQLRTEATLSSKPQRASVFVSGIGYYELRINGVKVGNHKLDVGWTDYSKRRWYASYDVTEQLVAGPNAFAVSLGNGRFKGTQLLLQAHINYGTGSSQVIASNTSWKSAQGPITYDDLYNGETYDARLETPGWDLPGFDDSAWKPAVAAEATSAVVASQLFQPITQNEEFEPVSITQPKPDMYIVDFGQNFAGWCRIKVHGAAGQNVTIRHAELLMHPPYGEQDGTIYVANLRGAKATDTYTLKGNPDGEVYEPKFTQHGFRFAEVTGLGYPLGFDDIRGIGIHTETEETGQVSFSIPLLNDIEHMVYMGHKTNLMSVPTDCDQRDERMGWTGDAALTTESAVHHFDLSAFYTHWVDQFIDEQGEHGEIPNLIPGHGGMGAPNWATAFPTVIWTLYTYQGNVDLVKEHWASLQLYESFWDDKFKQTGFPNYQSGFGDWVPPPPAKKANGHLVGAFAYLHDLQMMADMAKAIGDLESHRGYSAKFRSLADGFNDAFWDSQQNCYGKGGATCLQTENALPLWLGIVPTANQQALIDYLVKDIMVNNANHTTAGIVGQKFMFEALSVYGRGDVPLIMSQQTTYPSYGYMLTNQYEPATTVWELWNSDQDGPGMNSRNHIMFGTVSSWFFKYLAGVRPLTPGYGTFTIAPTEINVANLTLASVSVATPHGVIESSWAVGSNAGSCKLVAEGQTASLNCNGPLIEKVTFASFGTPTGSCASGFQASSCNAKNSTAIVEKACINKTSCSVEAADTLFGDPCYGTKKSLAVAVQCSGGASVAWTWHVSVPFGTQATVVVPVVTSLGFTTANLNVIEGTNTVWKNQAFVPGTPGISAASATANGVAITAAGGDYVFSMAIAD